MSDSKSVFILLLAVWLYIYYLWQYQCLHMTSDGTTVKILLMIVQLSTYYAWQYNCLHIFLDSITVLMFIASDSTSYCLSIFIDSKTVFNNASDSTTVYILILTVQISIYSFWHISSEITTDHIQFSTYYIWQ